MGGKNSSESGKNNSSRPSSFNYRNHSQGQQWSTTHSSEVPYYQNYPPSSHRYDDPVGPYPPSLSFSASHAYPPENYYPKPSSYPQPSKIQSSSSSSSSSSAACQLPRLDRRYSKIADDYKSLDEESFAARSCLTLHVQKSQTLLCLKK
ncbi:hypothetical protein KSP40_PGU009227 [Platanthera guangdongensis]|uniref:Uncharacterized protein n=1 Tax=Platanthera guangdongensis TaxID=2320717 RepID=A0ABR2M5E3_9ASPA